MPKSADLRAVGEFAASRYGVITKQQAATYGISRDVMDRLVVDGVVDRPRANVYCFVAHPRTWRQQLYVATVERVGVAASHRSATALQRIDGFADPPAIPELTSRFSPRVDVRGAVVHRSLDLPADDIILIDGIPCTTLARTAIDLARYVTARDLTRILDDVQRRGASMRWVFERASALQRRGRGGPSSVLEDVRPRLDGQRPPDSWFERLLAACLRSPLLAGLVRQHELYDDDGSFIARFDLALPWVRLGIEAHSRQHHFGRLVEEYDEDRDMRAAKVGWDTQYLGYAATRSPSRVCRDIEQIVLRRCQDLGVSPTFAA